MPDRPGAQFRDHPHMVAGRAAMPRPLADFAGYEFATQCPLPACRFRRFPVAPIAAARGGKYAQARLPTTSKPSAPYCSGPSGAK